LAHDLFEWTNAIVGGFSLFITGIAAVQASKAKTAARLAEKGVRRQNAVDAFTESVRDISEISAWIASRSFSEATVKLSQLNRHQAIHREEFSEQLSQCHDQIKLVQDLCTGIWAECEKGRRHLPCNRLEVLSQECHQTEVLLGSILGKVKRSIFQESAK